MDPSHFGQVNVFIFLKVGWISVFRKKDSSRICNHTQTCCYKFSTLVLITLKGTRDTKWRKKPMTNFIIAFSSILCSPPMDDFPNGCVRFLVLVLHCIKCYTSYPYHVSDNAILCYLICLKG